MLTNPLRDRFGIVARLEFYTLDELKRFDTSFDAGALKRTTIEQVVNVKNSEGGTSPRRVRQQITQLKRLTAR